MTATNMCSNFGGFRCSTSLINLKKRSFSEKNFFGGGGGGRGGFWKKIIALLVITVVKFFS